MNLKVQRTDDHVTANAMINSGWRREGDVLTFIAYSDTMKARVLEKIAAGWPYRVTVTDDPAVDGEWFEPLVPAPLPVKRVQKT
jgi:hypothetical protein